MRGKLIVIFCLQGVWTLNAQKGKNIQLHFQEFDLENINDVVEVRDGGEFDSLLLGKTEISTLWKMYGSGCLTYREHIETDASILQLARWKYNSNVTG